ncbi:MAG: nucleotidyltransferase domain-containing protein [Tepidisphaeraceae bacterium]|jgi:predicted nucleotidyltransferase
MVHSSEIQALADEIAKRFNPEKIILFGSHAGGSAHEHSDVDLLIVMDYQGRMVDRAMDIWSAIRPNFAVDLIVRRPDEVVRQYQQYDPLAREAMDKGKVLYDRGRARVAG